MTKTEAAKILEETCPAMRGVSREFVDAFVKMGMLKIDDISDYPHSIAFRAVRKKFEDNGGRIGPVEAMMAIRDAGLKIVEK